MLATARKIADDLGVSPATVSQVKNGVYNGRAETAARVRAALNLAEAPAAPLFTTEGQQQMAVVLEAAAEDRELALIVAPSGSGKTFIAERFAAERAGNPPTERHWIGFVRIALRDGPLDWDVETRNAQIVFGPARLDREQALRLCRMLLIAIAVTEGLAS